MRRPKLSEVDPSLLTTIDLYPIWVDCGYLTPIQGDEVAEPLELEDARTRQERHRREAGAKKRQYLSKYVGVTWHRHGWLGAWGGRANIKRSSAYPPTDEGQEHAAWARARALGRDWELRPADRVKPTTPHSASQGTACGVSRRKLGGKRVA